MNEDGNYIELSDGGRFVPFHHNNKPDPEVIAHALGNICRFTGHCRFFYSVAEHCVKCSYLVPPEFALEALLHDGHEIYTNDLSKPVKNVIQGSYKHLEDVSEEELRTQYGLPNKISPEVKHADILMVLVEARDLLPSKGEDWDYFNDYHDEAAALYKDQRWYRPQGWEPVLKGLNGARSAANIWLDRFKELTNET